MENITEWLSSTGFLFPSNELELERFNKLYPESDVKEEYDIKIERILSGNVRTIVLKADVDEKKVVEIRQYRMVARFGDKKELPPNIMDKIRKNESKNKGDASSKKEEN